MPIAAFDDHHDYFATISADNRLTLWNVASGQLKKEFVEDTQLANTYTSMAWGSSSTKEAKESSGLRGMRQNLLAIGTSVGGIILWDLNQGKVLKFFEGHRGKVTHVLFSKSGDFIYSCSEDMHVIQWSISAGTAVHKFKKDTQPLSRLALNSDETVLAVGGTVIKLLDLASKRVVKKFGGHQKSVTNLLFSEDDKLLFSAANDRYVIVWDSDVDSNNTTQLQSLISEIPTQELDLSSQNGGLYHVLGYSATGPEISLWEYRHTAENSSKKPKQPASKVRTSAIRAAFHTNNNLILAREVNTKYNFIYMTYQENDEILAEIKENSVKTPATPLQADKKAKVHTPADGKVARSTIAGGKVAENSGQTIQEKLDVIQADLNKEPVDDGKVNNDSLENILQQALQKGDSHAIAKLLSVHSEDIVSNTICKLPSEHIPQLLVILTQKFEKHPEQRNTLVWLRAIFQFHASYMIGSTSPEASVQMERLYLTLDSRLSMFKKLCKLGGKLDVLLSQSNRFKQQQMMSGPVYDESSSDEDSEGEEEGGDDDVEVDDVTSNGAEENGDVDDEEADEDDEDAMSE